MELNKPAGHLVQYIDYGDQAVVHPRIIYSVEKKFMTLLRQEIFCSLKNIAPASGDTWSTSSKMNVSSSNSTKINI